MESSKKKKGKRKKKEVSDANLIKMPPIETESSNDKDLLYNTLNLNQTNKEDELLKKFMNTKKSDTKYIFNFTNCIFFSKYKVTNKISEGNYSKIYQIINMNTNEKYACKIEAKNAEQPLLDYEYKIMDYYFKYIFDINL